MKSWLQYSKLSLTTHFGSYFPSICLFFFFFLSAFTVLNSKMRRGKRPTNQTNTTKWKHFNGDGKSAMLSNRDLKVGRKQQRLLLQKCRVSIASIKLLTDLRKISSLPPPNLTSLQCRTCSDLQQLTAVHTLKSLNSSSGAHTNPTQW